QSNQAVDETRGNVMTYNGQLILAYFHANSGGVTEDAGLVWTAVIPYLKSIRDDYSLKAPVGPWKQSMSLEDVRKALIKNKNSIGPIEKILPGDFSPSGRITKVRIVHGGHETLMSGNDFRLKTSPWLIKSTLFAMNCSEVQVVFEGRGAGHGVGMSQWGAYIMAREGRSYQEILKFYYHGVHIQSRN
ncbi:MAG: SpoIID/LytB domain-containing protein, partial [Syntrophales bacterium]|nr:SpoIID/LytB domain-containing protein [Syntrophales bacterium]